VHHCSLAAEARIVWQCRTSNAVGRSLNAIDCPTTAIATKSSTASCSCREKATETLDDVRRLLLAVEVLSPSTARADRVRKRALYRDEGVPEYWMVDLDARTFERTKPADDRPEVLAERVVWMPEDVREPLVIELVAYFAAVLDA
jgi:Uma2 family endonuclease